MVTIWTAAAVYSLEFYNDMDDELLTQLAQKIQNKYYGKYRGFVVDNADPEQLGRVRLKVPSVLGESETGWALPCMPFGGMAAQGMFVVPEIEAQVWVEFEEGELSYPIWTGTFWQQKGDAPVELEEDKPTQHVIQTPAGHRFLLEDAKDSETILLEHPEGAKVEIDPKGTVSVLDAQGATLVLDAEGVEVRLEDSDGNRLVMNSSGTTVEDSNGNKIEMAASGITVKAQQVVLDASQVALGSAAAEPLVKGQTFLTLYNSHTHATGVGPSGPPIPPATPAILSTKVKTA